jgi:hypothetical protein
MFKLTDKEKEELFKARYLHKAYSDEERIEMFVEHKYRVPTMHKNKKKYDRRKYKKFVY